MHRNTFGRFVSQVKPVIAETKTEPVKEEPKRRIAYKGFDKDLKCREEQFEVGETYSMPNPKPNPKLCSSDGWHFCWTLNKVYSHYSPYQPHGKKNRYCIIEVLGYETSDHDKSITTSFKILKEITEDDIKQIEEKTAHERMLKSFGLPLVQKLQTKYPLMQVTGSVGLFLHGISLNRWKNGAGSSDLDLILPYWHNIEEDEDFEVYTCDEERSGNDYNECLVIDGKKCDVRIDAEQKYETIEFEGFKYRVSKIEYIMQAKVKYMMAGQLKHKEDCYEIFGKTNKDAVKKPVLSELDEFLINLK